MKNLRSKRSRRCFHLTKALVILIVMSIAAPIPRIQAHPQISSLGKLSPALQQALAGATELVWSNQSAQTLRVLIQTNGPVSAALISAIALQGGFVVRQFTSIDGLLAEIPTEKLLSVAGRDDVELMTADHLAQQAASHLEAATTVDGLRTKQLLGNGFVGLDGTGVGIAILDSGIMSGHGEFSDLLLSSRVVASKDIVSSNTNLLRVENLFGIVRGLLGFIIPSLSGNNDGYGHGSHVAGIAAGRSFGTSGSRGYMGIAPNANLIDVRVLDGFGLGQTSDVIAGIDWVVANRTRYNIRVMNLSLGAASTESYVTDPLCRAVRRAVASGVTVVAAAGNFGSSATGIEQYGSITAPGNDPTVITVGAANTHQTDGRFDETITYFSSRGPTRGYSVGASGNKQHDNLLKPDLVAPGNRMVAAESADDWLATKYPQLHVSGSGTKAFMQLSGSSVAAPAVAGAAALLLQKNPGLTPPLIKAILQYSAQQLPNASLVQGGAGLLNIDGAVKLAGVLRQDISTAIALRTINVGNSLLRSGAAFPAPVSTSGGQTFSWGGYIFAGGSHVLAGAELFKRYQRIYDPNLVWVRQSVTLNENPMTPGSLITSGVISAEMIAGSSGFFVRGMQISDGLAAGQGIVLTEGIILSEGMVLCEGIILSEAIILSEGIIMSEAIIMSEGIVMSEGTNLPSGIVLSESYNLGET